MNIFIFDSDVEANAQAYPDRLIVKMMLELTQILSTANPSIKFYKLNGECYKPTHKNHPAVTWAQDSPSNYAYVASLAICLTREYQRRFMKESSFVKTLEPIKCLFTKELPTKFVLIINSEWIDLFYQTGILDTLEYQLTKTKLVDLELAIKCYRQYLIQAKTYAEWRYTKPPLWWPRQEGSGRLFCPLPKTSGLTKALPFGNDEDIEQTTAVIDAHNLCKAKCKLLGKRALSKQALLEHFMNGGDVYKLVEDHVNNVNNVNSGSRSKSPQVNKSRTKDFTIKQSQIEVLIYAYGIRPDMEMIRTWIKQNCNSKVPVPTRARFKREVTDVQSLRTFLTTLFDYWSNIEDDINTRANA